MTTGSAGITGSGFYSSFFSQLFGLSGGVPATSVGQQSNPFGQANGLGTVGIQNQALSYLTASNLMDQQFLGSTFNQVSGVVYPMAAGVDSTLTGIAQQSSAALQTSARAALISAQALQTAANNTSGGGGGGGLLGGLFGGIF